MNVVQLIHTMLHFSSVHQGLTYISDSICTLSNLQQNSKIIPQVVRQTTNAAAQESISSIPPYAEKLVGKWLLTCAGMAFGAVVLGGVTRYFYTFSPPLWCLVHHHFPEDRSEKLLTIV
jgi:hypothetical protein